VLKRISQLKVVLNSNRSLTAVTKLKVVLDTTARATMIFHALLVATVGCMGPNADSAEALIQSAHIQEDEWERTYLEDYAPLCPPGCAFHPRRDSATTDCAMSGARKKARKKSRPFQKWRKRFNIGESSTAKYCEKARAFRKTPAFDAWFRRLCYSRLNFLTKLCCPSYSLNRIAVGGGRANVTHALLVLIPFAQQFGTEEQRRDAASILAWIASIESEHGERHAAPLDPSCPICNEIYFTWRACRFVNFDVAQAKHALGLSTCDFARVE
jgi:hypothetical protein